MTADSAASRRVLARTPVAPLPASTPKRPTGITGRTSAPPETSSPEVCSFQLPLTTAAGAAAASSLTTFPPRVAAIIEGRRLNLPVRRTIAGMLSDRRRCWLHDQPSPAVGKTTSGTLAPRQHGRDEMRKPLTLFASVAIALLVLLLPLYALTPEGASFCESPASIALVILVFFSGPPNCTGKRYSDGWIRRYGWDAAQRRERPALVRHGRRHRPRRLKNIVEAGCH